MTDETLREDSVDLDASFGELCGRAAGDEFVAGQAAVAERRVAGHELDEGRPLIVHIHVDFLVVERLIHLSVVIVGRVRQQTMRRVTTLIHQPFLRSSARHNY